MCQSAATGPRVGEGRDRREHDPLRRRPRCGRRRRPLQHGERQGRDAVEPVRPAEPGLVRALRRRRRRRGGRPERAAPHQRGGDARRGRGAPPLDPGQPAGRHRGRSHHGRELPGDGGHAQHLQRQPRAAGDPGEQLPSDRHGRRADPLRARGLGLRGERERGGHRKRGAGESHLRLSAAALS